MPRSVGKQAIAAENEKFHAQHPGFKVLSYTSKYNNLQVEDGLACEWFEKKGEYKLSPESPPASWHANGLLVLKRQSDGSWKGVMAFPISWDEFPSGGMLRRNSGRVNQDEHGSSVGNLPKGVLTLFSWACEVVVKKAFNAAAKSE